MSVAGAQTLDGVLERVSGYLQKSIEVYTEECRRMTVVESESRFQEARRQLRPAALRGPSVSGGLSSANRCSCCRLRQDVIGYMNSSHHDYSVIPWTGFSYETARLSFRSSPVERLRSSVFSNCLLMNHPSISGGNVITWQIRVSYFWVF